MPKPSPGRVLILLAALLGSPAMAADAGQSLKAAAAASNTYLVVYSPGPGWLAGKPMREQPGLREHFAYYLGLHAQGRLLAGGGFTDGSGGAAVFTADDDEAAAALVAADPAVKSGAFRHELRGWKPNDWDAIARRRAAK